MLNWLKKIFRPSTMAEAAKSDVRETADPPQSAATLAECETWRKRGNEALKGGDPNVAADCYRKAIDLCPDYAAGLLNLGFVLNSLGRSLEAEQYLRRALQINPEAADAYFVLGEILRNHGDLDGAIENYRKVVELNPEFELAYSNLYDTLVQNGQMREARQLPEQALVHNPTSVTFNLLRGDLLAEENAIDRAIACYKTALSVDPHFYPALVHLGNALNAQGNQDEALKSYQNALEVNPQAPDIHNNLGALFQERGEWERAETYYRKAIELSPSFYEGYNNLAGLLLARGRMDEAMAAFHQALAINGNSGDVRNNLGKALAQQGHLSDAEMEFRKAIELDPGLYDAFNNLGTVLKNLGRVGEAIESFRQAIKIKPDFVMAQNNMGVVFQEQGDFGKALACYKQALVWKPDSAETKVNILYVALYLNDWRDLKVLSEEARRAIHSEGCGKTNKIAPFSFLAIPSSTAEEQQICSQIHAQGISDAARSGRNTLNFKFSRKVKPKIKLGYLSADYRYHPVAHLMAEIFSLHDRDRFEVCAYSIGPDDKTGMRERLRASFDKFVDLRDMSDVDAAKEIYAGQVDILINLTGYTQHGRAGIAALRPAPIQVNYLGYPGTMGAEFMDYLIADPFIIPDQYKKYYTEEVLWLPDSYMPRDSSVRRLPAPTREECGLPETGFVFCSFNQPYKITPEVFDVWCRLLTAVPGSVLWLPAFKPEAEENLRREAIARGVPASRIIRAPRADKIEDHLARLQCADLFLDTTPYNAHTTCSDALWVGLPVITCAGETFSSRVAGGLLTAIGVPELVTYSLDDYYALALSLATNSEKYGQMRARVLASSRSAPLFDSKKFTRDLETLYHHMWENYLNAAPPQPVAD